jgi:hypothetical protein
MWGERPGSVLAHSPLLAGLQLILTVQRDALWPGFGGVHRAHVRCVPAESL